MIILIIFFIVVAFIGYLIYEGFRSLFKYFKPKSRVTNNYDIKILIQSKEK